MFNTLTAWPKTALNFVRESRQELKKVSWPTRETTIRYTILVVVSSIAVGFITGGIDYLFTLLIERFIV